MLSASQNEAILNISRLRMAIQGAGWLSEASGRFAKSAAAQGTPEAGGTT
jgi:hypothetical protein